MPRPRNPNRDKAKQLYLESDGNRLIKDIAAELGLPDNRVRKWKAEENWDADLNRSAPIQTAKSKRSAPKPKGAPKGNQNASGNSGGAPEGNQNAVITGLYARIMNVSEDERAYLEEMLGQDDLGRLDTVYGVSALKLRRIVQQAETLDTRQMLADGITRIENEKGRSTTTTIKSAASRLDRLDGAAADLLNLMRRTAVDKHKMAYENAKLEIERKRIDPQTPEDLQEDGFIEALSAQADAWEDHHDDHDTGGLEDGGEYAPHVSF